MKIVQRALTALLLAILWLALMYIGVSATKYLARPHDLEERIAVVESEIITLRAETRRIQRLLEEQ